jgi:hypothetical protein
MKVLIDSNIVIYSAQQEYQTLRNFLSHYECMVSDITYLEVLGYDRLTDEESLLFERFFKSIEIIPISSTIIKHAVILSRQKKPRNPRSLADFIIAATALTFHLTLVTRNTKDFDWIKELILINPFEL